jgi:NADH-quinone oxidoreductase subunit J
MNILLEQLIFAFFAVLLLFSALMVISSRNPVRSALSLVIAFIASAGLWLLLGAEFLALILVLVYVGAVMTLFLFVVMTLNLDKDLKSEGFVHYLPYGILVLTFIAGIVIYAIKQQQFAAARSVELLSRPVDYSNIKALGSVLYTYYAYPFELAGTLLLIAIVAAISLDLRIRRSKKQKSNQQVAADPKKRIRLIK